MKTLVALLALSLSAQAFNTKYEKVEFGKTTTAQTYRNNSTLQTVSLLLEVKDTEGKFPIVANYSKEASSVCQFKQSLIHYSGFDSKSKQYVRVYEVQVALKANRKNACSLTLSTKIPSSVKESAIVNIL